jgi:hypothetical protein
MDKNKNLLHYIKESFEKGLSKKDIYEELSLAGWSKEESDEAYRLFLKERGVPFPDSSSLKNSLLGGGQSSVLEVILNIFSFILLGISIFSFGFLYFAIIEHFFPDRYMYAFSYGGVQNALAGVIVAFPLFFFIFLSWVRRFGPSGGKRESRFTLWFTYIILLISALVIVGDIIAVLHSFLRGELTLRFGLKALTIFVLSAFLFVLYAGERRMVQYKKDISSFAKKGLLIFGAVLFFSALILGFMVIGSPFEQRARAFDAERVENLYSIEMCISEYTRLYGKLPENLNQTLNNSSLYSCTEYFFSDPETEEEYKYSIVSDISLVDEERGVSEGVYQLCATFHADSINEENQRIRNNRSFSSYEKGFFCKNIVVISHDKEIFLR